jgi:hypothetical protein
MSPPDPGSVLYEWGAYFCANERCVLHVRAGDAGVTGEGNWARLPNGLTIGRNRYSGRVLCDLCGRAELAARAGR